MSAVFLNALSRSLEEQEPQAALRFNPFNADARVAAIAQALNAPAALDLDAVTQSVRDGIRLDRVDARFRSLLGEIQLRNGDAAAAYRLFVAAHQLSATELDALRRLIVHAAETGDYAQAMRLLDVLFRRWPGEFDAMAPALPGVLASPDAYKAALAALVNDPPWRGRLLSVLAHQEASMPYAYRLALDLMSTTAAPTRAEIRAIVDGLTRAGRYLDAHRLFLFTLAGAELALTGFVYNSHFAQSEGVPPFAWDYRSTSAADIHVESAPPEQGAMVRFLDKPARDIRLRQVLILEPGSYRLTVAASAAGLEVPRGLYWSLRCLAPAGEVTRLAIEPGTYRNRTFVANFDIGSCGAQSIELRSGLVLDSWLYLYAGRVIFHSLDIERRDRAADKG